MSTRKISISLALLARTSFYFALMGGGGGWGRCQVRLPILKSFLNTLMTIYTSRAVLFSYLYRWHEQNGRGDVAPWNVQKTHKMCKRPNFVQTFRPQNVQTTTFVQTFRPQNVQTTTFVQTFRPQMCKSVFKKIHQPQMCKHHAYKCENVQFWREMCKQHPTK